VSFDVFLILSLKNRGIIVKLDLSEGNFKVERVPIGSKKLRK